MGPRYNLILAALGVVISVNARATSVSNVRGAVLAPFDESGPLDNLDVADGAEEEAAKAIADADSLDGAVDAAPQVVGNFAADAAAPMATADAVPPPGIVPRKSIEGSVNSKAEFEEVQEAEEMAAQSSFPTSSQFATAPSPASVIPQAPAAAPVTKASKIVQETASAGPASAAPAPAAQTTRAAKMDDGIGEAEASGADEINDATEDAETMAEVDEEIAEAERDGTDSDNDDNQEIRSSQDVRSESEHAPSEEHHFEKLQKDIAKETKSEALAEMVGSLKMDMYFLKDKINELHRDISKGVTLAGPDPAETLVYPVSVCMQCILVLTAVYFVVYTVLAACKVITEFLGIGENSTLELALQSACETISFAPMLCVLFLGTQLRAAQISEETHGPPLAAEYAMELCTWSVIVLTILVLALPAFTGEVAVVSADGLKFPSHENRAVASLLTIIRYAALAGMYVGLIVVCMEAVLMDTRSLNVTPTTLWDDPTTAATEYAPPLCIAMQCTLFLTHIFFVVYLLLAVLRSLTHLLGNEALPGNIHDEPPVLARDWAIRWERCFRVCASTVSLVPMVCIVFMAARMRALEVDPREGRPQWWAGMLFKVCATAVAAQVLLVLAPQIAGIAPDERPFSRSSIIADGAREDGALSELSCAEASIAERVILILRGIFALAAHGSVAGIAVSIILIGSSHHHSGTGHGDDGGEDHHTPPVSPAQLCVIMLSVVYFGVYLCLFVAQATAMIIFSFSSTMSHTRVEALLRTVQIFKMGECTVRLCPMVALLFLGARMRALHLSDYQGSPQCWAQDAMYAATFAIITNLFVILIAGVLSKRVYVEPDGSPVTKRMGYLPGRVFLEVIKAISLLTLYGGVVVVGASVLSIRPETAGCSWRGFQPLVHH